MQRAVIALGANLGDRARNISHALHLVREFASVERTSGMYLSAPMYKLDQPVFYNAAASVHTRLQPHELLDALQAIERAIGRRRPVRARELERQRQRQQQMQQRHGSVELATASYANAASKADAADDAVAAAERYGPRPIDLDIVLYGIGRDADNAVAGNAANTLGTHVQSERLQVPHPKMREREFVLQPLRDLGIRVPRGDAARGQAPLRQIVPVSSNAYLPMHSCTDNNDDNNKGGAHQYPHQAPPPPPSPPTVMGIVNVTPDSFSDGDARNLRTEHVLAIAARLVERGARILDVGGQSTRPGADTLPPDDECARVVPAIRALRAAYPRPTDALISIDTFYARVARAAVAAGADMVNDVSAGALDDGMLPAVADLCVPLVLMHMRGTPQTMSGLAAYSDDDNDEDDDEDGNSGGGVRAMHAIVADELRTRVRAAEAAGVPRWHLLVDPGIGFAKRRAHDAHVMRNLSAFRARVSAGGARLPLLVGASRKRFLGEMMREWRAERVPTSGGGASDDCAAVDRRLGIDRGERRGHGSECGSDVGAAAVAIPSAAERDFASAGAAAWAIMQGADVVRVHNANVSDTVHFIRDMLRGDDDPAAGAPLRAAAPPGS